MYKLIIIALAVAATADATRAFGAMGRPAGPMVDLPTFETNNFCQGCRSMVSFMQTFNSTQMRAQSRHIFKSFCELYYEVSTDFRQGPCPLFVQAAMNFLDRIDPVHHCDQIGACDPTPYAADDGDSMDDDPADEAALLGNSLPNHSQEMICTLCEDTVKQVQEQLKDPKFVEQLHQQVDAFCDYLKVVDQDKQCRQMVNKYIDQAIDFVKNMDPLDYCRSLKLCSAEQVVRRMYKLIGTLLTPYMRVGLVMNKNVQKPTEEIQSAERAPLCMICKTIVVEMMKYLNNNRTEEYIEQGLLKVCSYAFPRGGSNAQQCRDMVSAYTKELVKLLADESDPEIICMLIGQCTYVDPKTLISTTPNYDNLKLTSSLTELKPAAEKHVSIAEFITKLDPDIPLNSMRTCVECKLFVSYLQETFQDKKTRDSLKNWLLDNLCKSLTEPEARDSCINMVNHYSDDFFKAIAEQLEPGVVCQDLKACRKRKACRRSRVWLINLQESSEPAAVGIIQNAMALGTAPSAKDGVCDQCISVVVQLDDYLSSHSIDDDVSVLIDQVCNKFTDQSTKDKCTDLVEMFGKQIVEAIHTMDNPRQFCSKIFLC